MPAGYGFFHDVLHHRAVHHGQHLLGNGFGHREHAGAEARGGITAFLTFMSFKPHLCSLKSGRALRGGYTLSAGSIWRKKWILAARSSVRRRIRSRRSVRPTHRQRVERECRGNAGPKPALYHPRRAPIIKALESTGGSGANHFHFAGSFAVMQAASSVARDPQMISGAP